MVRHLLILMLFTTPCFAQGMMGNMSAHGGIGSSQHAIQNHGDSFMPNGQFNYNFGNNPNVYKLYRPQVSDYLTPDPGQLKAYSSSTVKPEYNYPMRRYLKFNQFNFNQPLN